MMFEDDLAEKQALRMFFCDPGLGERWETMKRPFWDHVMEHWWGDHWVTTVDMCV